MDSPSRMLVLSLTKLHDISRVALTKRNDDDVNEKRSRRERERRVESEDKSMNEMKENQKIN